MCAYTSLEAQLAIPVQELLTAVCFVDMEARSVQWCDRYAVPFFENTVAELLECMGEYSELKSRRALSPQPDALI